MVNIFQPNSVSTENEKIATKYIRGTVVDSLNKTIIHGASIHIWNTVNRAKVLESGEFSLEIPEYLQTDVVIIEVKFSKYDSKIRSFKINDLTEFLTIELEPKDKQVKSSSKSRWRFFN